MEKHHVKKLFGKHTVGEQITFEKNLKIWKVENNASQSSKMPLKQLPSQQTPTIAHSIPSTSINSVSPLLSKILTDANGQIIIQYYNKNKDLNDISKDCLVNLIVNYCLTNDIRISTNIANNLSDQIVSHFPGEAKVNNFLF